MSEAPSPEVAKERNALIAELERAAKQIGDEGYAGWGNTCQSAADYLRREWQPIETAPPQGQLVLFCNMKATEMRHVYFVDWMVGGQFCGNRHNTATHWMHIAASPKTNGN